jgi:excisionase family DNA binding protein
VNTERLLNARELAELLGLSNGTVLDRFERGDLPGFRLYGGKVGAPVRFRWSEIEALLERGRCGPAATNSSEAGACF